ncbi:MAG: DNA repair exonuclease, partial [Clostridia bacterium]|nr:DNA repair exonuclease [Clostridia bacterium]
MPTFVHTGDVHLDTPFSANFSQKQMQIRRREVMQTFRSIVLAAKDKDFLLISGDLFDGQFVSADTISFVKRCFAEIPDTQILMVAGNHDPYLPDSVYATEFWGDNVHIFGTEWEFFDFPEKKTRVHGRSFRAPHEEISLMKEISLADGWCNLMLLHGEIVAVGGESSYNPIEKNALARCGVDYVALGHIHQRSSLARLDGVYYAYCGIPEGRGFDEEGEKGY